MGRGGGINSGRPVGTACTATTTRNNIIGKVRSKQNIWKVNIDDEYHEEKG